jgi:tetratricopeptide (TPR) repeat protein
MKTFASTMTAALLGLTLLTGTGRGAETAPAAATRPANGEDLYAQTLPSIAWVVQPKATGTGWVVDRERKWLVTNFHVVADGKGGAVEVVRLLFAAYEDGELVAERSYYEKRMWTASVGGTVVYADAQRDLAVIEAEKLPADAKALPLAARGARPGQAVFGIGNPGASDALFVYNEGTVRAVYHSDYLLDGVQHVVAKVVETQDPINPGDSGSPLLNRAGEVVAVNNSTSKAGSLMSGAIDLTELRAVLKAAADAPPPNAAKKLTAKGDAAKEARKFDEAREAYTAALAADPKYVPALDGRAWVNNELKDYDKALEDCDAALALDPKDAFALKERAYAHGKKGEKDEQLADFERLTDVTPDDLPLYLRCADMNMAKGDLDAALEDCTKALDRNKDFAAAYEKRGDVYAAQKRFDKALADYRAAAKRVPLGGSAQLKDKLKQAEAKLKEAPPVADAK